MKHILYKIFVIVSLFCLICCKDVYAVKSEFNNALATIIFSGDSMGWTKTDDENIQRELTILENLKSIFGYEGNVITKEMKFETTITIVDRWEEKTFPEYTWYTDVEGVIGAQETHMEKYYTYNLKFGNENAGIQQEVLVNRHDLIDYGEFKTIDARRNSTG